MQETSTSYSEFFDVGLLSRLPDLEVQARYLVTGFLSGLHRSPFRGFSVEFKEYRAYQPGDELRMVDWKVFGRTDRLNVRLREEETNLSAYLLMDMSASMNYGSPRSVMNKWHYARSLAAAFILFLHRQMDATSLSLVGEKMDHHVPPSLKTSDFHQMLALLHKEPNAKTCNLADGLMTIATLARHRSLVLVFSDFYEDPAKLEKPLGRLRYMGCEPMLFHVLDPRELEFDFEDDVLLQELESQERLALNPDLLRKEYVNAIQANMKAVEYMAHRFGGDYIQLRTDESPLKALGAYLARRNGYL